MRADFSNLPRLPEVLATLRDKFDDVIVDCPAGLGETVRCLTQGADLALVVTTPDLAAVRDARRTMQMLAQMNREARLVINRIRPSLIQQGDAPDVDDIIDSVGAQSAGAYPGGCAGHAFAERRGARHFSDGVACRRANPGCGAAPSGGTPAPALSVSPPALPQSGQGFSGIWT